MSLLEFLEANKDKIMSVAADSLERANLTHYAKSTKNENKERLNKLFELTFSCVKSKSMIDIIEYSAAIAKQRFEAGFDFHEVHTVFNVLEESIWKCLMQKYESDELVEALSLISSILGMGKESLACTYINLVSKSKNKSLDLSQIC